MYAKPQGAPYDKYETDHGGGVRGWWWGAEGSIVFLTEYSTRMYGIHSFLYISLLRVVSEPLSRVPTCVRGLDVKMERQGEEDRIRAVSQ